MSILDTEKTIVAIATPIGVGGLSVVRLSGKKSVIIADKLFKSVKGKLPSSFKSRELVYGTFCSDLVKDNCLCVVFKAPNSFTGELVVEFQCHGGVKSTNYIVQSCIQQGAYMAMPGEFSMRAFINGKMTLAEAEGMIDYINAESDAGIKASYELMNGGLSNLVNDFQKQIIDLISDIEVSFDYPEEDMEYQTKKQIEERLAVMLDKLELLINSAKSGSIIKNGINVAIVGKPNVGKSSLLNALLNKEKAIVTDIAGTTRDVIEDAFEINGIKVNIIDTAGIRNSLDVVEQIGVDKSKQTINNADCVLFVVDGSKELDVQDVEILNMLKNKKYLTIYNKADKLIIKPTKNGVYVSAKNKVGIDELKQKIFNLIIDKNIVGNGMVITNERHTIALKNAYKSLKNAFLNIKKATLDLISVDLNEAYSSLGEITGTTASEAILDSIFSKFCLGK